MSDEVRCAAVANLKGEHVPCDGSQYHGQPHGNTEYGLIWQCDPDTIHMRHATEADEVEW